jgi:hypothetical protein
MSHILTICPDLEQLKEIVKRLPGDIEQPIAAKRTDQLNEKLPELDLNVVVIHHSVDGELDAVTEAVEGLDKPPRTLFLANDPSAHDGFDKVLKFPVPGPVFRNALNELSEPDDDELDRDDWEAFQEDLEQRLEHLEDEEATYYDILDVEPDAGHQQILDSFDRLSRRYHPDRYTQHRDKEWGRAVYENAEKLYRLVTEAYEVLKDREYRKAYDQRLEDGETRMAIEDREVSESARGPDALTDLANERKSKKFLRMAQASLARDDVDAAIQNIEFALDAEPENDQIQQKLDELQDEGDEDDV